MKGRFWKKTLSVCLALLMVAALVPAQLIASVGAATSNTAYIYRWWDSESKQVKSETRYAEATKLQDLSADLQDLNSGWYYSQNWIEFNKRVTIHGTVNIIICEEGGSYVKFKDGIHVSPGNTLNIYGQGAETQALEAFADTNDYAGIGGNGSEGCGDINIYGGLVNAKADVDAAGIGGGFKGDGGHINIYGGKINATGGSENFDGGAGIGGGGGDDGVGGFGGFIKIYGGDVTAQGGANAAGIGGGDEGTSGDIEIFGGTVHAYGGPGSSDGGAGIGGGNEKGVNNIVIYNGDVTAHGCTDAAGIGGGDGGDGGNITIAGGTVDATGGKYGAGIGGGEDGFEFEIKITNAQVTATGGINAAGIGGGDGATVGTITIIDSSVNATGGSEYSDGGAGIGGGNEGNGGTITITNSKVGAQGGCDGAGIGGGDYGVGGDITITGGDVTARGGDEGAGIGGGQGKDGGNIKINDARVGGYGGDYAAGIGGGGYGSVSVGNGGVITINGGEVTAEGGEYGAGIGGGYQGKSGKITITDGTIEAHGGKGGAGVGTGAACPASEDAVDITIEGGDIQARGGSSTTEDLYGLYIFEGASIGAGGCTHELVLFTDPGDIEAVSNFAGTINLNGGTITANRTIGATEEESLDWVEKGEVYFNGATVQIETDEEYPSVRATTIIFYDEEGIRQKVSYADSVSGPYTVVPKDDRIPTLQALEKKYVKVSLCEHDNMIYTDNGDNHTESCPHCKYIATQAHEYGNPIWSWAENHSSATATFTCEKCGHKETVDAAVEKIVDDAGMATYTATAEIGGKSYTDSVIDYADELGARLVGHSISLDGDIGVNFYMELSDAVADSDTAYMHFTIPKNGEPDTQDIKVSDARTVKSGDKTYYVFKCQVAAKEMTSDIRAQIIDGEKQGTVFTYSVKEYADYLLTHTDEREDLAKAAPLVKALLNYGTYTQIYFDKNPGKLANVGLTEEEKALGEVTVNVSDYDVSGLPAGVTFAGASLSLKSETTLSLYFKSDDDLEFSCGDYFVQDVPNGEYQVARIRGIKAAHIGDMFTLNVNGAAVKYSPLNYIKKALNGGTDDVNLQNAVKAFYLYYNAADEYFNVIDLSTVTGNYEVQNSGVITGTLSGNHKITIADGATVRLRNADITLSANSDSARYAGITLLGDATIILEGTNTVRGGYIYHPGIFVPEGKTLTIDGTGSLDASSNGYGCGIGGCGFEHDMKCGNITINGGNITATGGNGSAGIGSGHSRSTNTSCGDITINGGTVTAIGGEYAAGIGCGYDGNCGNITINNTVTQVTAISGGDQYSAIGIGSGCSCGTVTIGGVRTGSINQSSYTYRPE